MEPFQRLVIDYFDRLGEAEWDRHESDLRALVGLEINKRFLARFLAPGQRVLDIGAGPGRFTIQAIEAGATVVVGDISQRQLEVNAERVSAAGAEHGVESRLVLDICDLSALEDDGFDLVVALGGPVSYAFEEAGRALTELARVTKPEGTVVGGAISLPGAAREHLDSFLPTIAVVGLEEFDDFLGHGDQRVILAAGAHPCRLFTWSTLRDLIEAAGLEVLATSSSQWLAQADPEALEALAADAVTWERFLSWEEHLCAQPGAVDGGRDILFAARPIAAER